MKKTLFFLLLCFIFPFKLKAHDIVKPGVYDFDEVITQMGDEPFIRKMFPNILGEPLFIMKMLGQENKDFYLSTKTLSGDSKIEYYAKKSALNLTVNNWLYSSMGKRKSAAVKKIIVTGITLARSYKGYNIILKPDSSVLYWNSSLSKDIAKSAAFYLEKQAKGTGDDTIEEEVDGPPTPSTSTTQNNN